VSVNSPEQGDIVLALGFSLFDHAESGAASSMTDEAA
jgi:hypothetical protein